jgi:hypothetical protein
MLLIVIISLLEKVKMIKILIFLSQLNNKMIMILILKIHRKLLKMVQMILERILSLEVEGENKIIFKIIKASIQNLYRFPSFPHQNKIFHLYCRIRSINHYHRINHI